RTGSTRLPDKVILPFYNEQTILDIIIENLKIECEHYPIIVATSINKNDDLIEEIAKKKNVQIFRGDEYNVLKRFINCAEEFNIQNIIRICADNPFLIPTYVNQLINSSLYKKLDYISYKNIQNTPVIKTHIGLFAEYVRLDSLKKVNEFTNEALYQEHVTNFIYNNPDLFSIKLINLPELVYSRNDLRFTCDTIDDFNMLQKLYYHYIEIYKTKAIDLNKLLKLVDSNNDYLSVMQKGINSFKK
ncbi:MAG: cytidylyltransferase domain-containing protein, partial [Bacteroidia bacterium]